MSLYAPQIQYCMWLPHVPILVWLFTHQPGKLVLCAHRLSCLSKIVMMVKLVAEDHLALSFVYQWMYSQDWHMQFFCICRHKHSKLSSLVHPTDFWSKQQGSNFLRNCTAGKILYCAKFAWHFSLFEWFSTNTLMLYHTVAFFDVRVSNVKAESNANLSTETILRRAENEKREPTIKSWLK